MVIQLTPEIIAAIRRFAVGVSTYPKSSGKTDRRDLSLDLALFALMPAAFFLRMIRTRRAAKSGRCSTCGYDLRATPGRCPECGTIPAKNINSYGSWLILARVRRMFGCATEGIVAHSADTEVCDESGSERF
jgi:hypothetical protein